MKIVKTKQDLEMVVGSARSEGKSIALVPTMGALHEGHLTLVRQAKSLADFVICSIFVNPTQFNDPEDLKKYPRPLAADISKLEEVECDCLFLPEVDEMYGENESWHLDLGDLDRTWEGAHRPGHFQGVTQIVYKLFSAAKPDIALFGQKDLQQYQVIQRLVDLKTLPVKLVMAPTIREVDGLAMSSRNVRLTALGRQQALVLSRTLNEVKERMPSVREGSLSLNQLKHWAETELKEAEGVTLEYFAICDRASLTEVTADHIPSEGLVALVAAWVDDVRLIDNLLLD